MSSEIGSGGSPEDWSVTSGSTLSIQLAILSSEDGCSLNGLDIRDNASNSTGSDEFIEDPTPASLDRGRMTPSGRSLVASCAGMLYSW